MTAPLAPAPAAGAVAARGAAAVTRIVPPQLGVARLNIPGFSKLTPGEQLQAAALALRRDVSVEVADLRLATRAMPGAPGSPHAVLVAWCDGAGRATPWVTDALAAITPGRLLWVGAPHGYLLGENGAVVVDAAAGSSLPAEAAAMLTAGSAHPVTDIVLVSRDTALLDDDRLALWAAASGVAMTDGHWPAVLTVPLQSPPGPRARTAWAALDRALGVALLAALLAVALTGWRWFAAAPAAGAVAVVGNNGNASGASPHAAPGALLQRVSLVAPELLPALHSATYAGGAWVLVLANGFDPASLRRAVAMLEANGLAVQTAQAAEPRLRVALPLAGSGTAAAPGGAR